MVKGKHFSNSIDQESCINSEAGDESDFMLGVGIFFNVLIFTVSRQCDLLNSAQMRMPDFDCTGSNRSFLFAAIRHSRNLREYDNDSTLIS